MKTACFYAYSGPGRVSIARFAPRNIPPGYRVYKALAPGPWFNSVDRAEYERLFAIQLAKLDATQVALDLLRLAAPAEPILTCYESADACRRGETFCHRHQVARWLFDELALVVEEIR